MPPRSPALAALLASTAVLLAGLTAAPARAAVAPVEPNEILTQAWGPLTAGETYTGSFTSANDVEWLFFYVNGPKHVDITVKALAPECSGPVHGDLRNRDGHYILTTGFDVAPNTSGGTGADIDGAGPVYLVLRSRCAGNPYAVTIGPADAISASPTGNLPRPTTSTTPTAEPNDGFLNPFGPLAAETWHAGDFTSPNDVDRLLFYAYAPKHIEVAVTKVGPGCSGSVHGELRNSYGHYVLTTGFDVGSDTIGGTAMDTDAAGPIYLVMRSPCAGNPYQLYVGPADAISATPTGSLSRPTTTSTPTAEPNDDLAHAFGPLAAATWYSGDFTSPNDKDWLRVNVNGAKHVEFSVAKVGAGCSGAIHGELRDRNGDYILTTGFDVGSDTIGGVTIDTTAPGPLHLVLSSPCAGNPYQVYVGPADALG